MNQKDIEELAQLLDEIKDNKVSRDKISKSLKKYEPTNKSLILYYVYTYVYPKQTVEFDELVGGFKNLTEEKRNEELFLPAFREAIELKLYDKASLIVLDDNCLRSQPFLDIIKKDGSTDSPNQTSLQSYIENNKLEGAVELARKVSPINGDRSKVFSLLFERISKDIDHEVGNFDICFYIIRRYMSFTGVDEANNFADAIEPILSSKDITSQLSKLLNPIRFIVQLIELTILFASRFKSMKLKFNQLKERLTQLALDILKEIDSVQKMKSILLDKDLDSRSTRALIVDYSLIELLDNPVVEGVANEVWYGPYSHTKNPLSVTSSLWEILEDKKGSVNKGFFGKDVNGMNTHWFEFSVWKKSAGLHVAFFWLEYLILTITIFGLELSINDAYGDMEKAQDKYNQAIDRYVSKGHKYMSSLTAKHDEYLNCARVARNRIFSWYFVALLALGSSLRFVTLPIYKILTGRTQNIFTLQWAINLILFLTLLIMYLPFQGEATLGIQHLKLDGAELIYMANKIDENQYISLLSAIAEFCLGLRLAYIFRFTYFLGPLFTTLGLMLWKTVQFGVIYFVILFVFSVAASLVIDPDHKGFENIGHIIFTLFQASLAGLDMNTYDLKSKIFYVFFSLIVSIVLLHFVVVLLNEVYSALASKAYIILYSEILALREEYKPNKAYQFMVHSYSIFDLLLCIIFLPFYPCLKKEKKKSLNDKLLYVEYTFCFILILPVYIIFELVLLPICYFMAMYKRIKYLTEEEKNEPFLYKLGTIVVFSVLELPLLVFRLMVDIYYFTRHAYTHCPKDENKGEHVQQQPKEEKSQYMYMERLENVVRNFREKYNKKENPQSIVDIIVGDLIRESDKTSEDFIKGELKEYILEITGRSQEGLTVYVGLAKLEHFLQKFCRKNTLRINLKENHNINEKLRIGTINANKKIKVNTFDMCYQKLYKNGIEKYFQRSITKVNVSSQLQEMKTNFDKLKEIHMK